MNNKKHKRLVSRMFGFDEEWYDTYSFINELPTIHTFINDLSTIYDEGKFDE